MKTPQLALLVLMTAASAFAQDTRAFTDAAGFSEVTIPAAASGVTTRRVLAVPYQRPGVFRGTVASVTGDRISLTSGSLTPGQFTGAPHYLKLRTGTNAGRYFRVTANDAGTVTVDAGADDLAATVAARTLVDVFPAQTLGSLFGAQVPFRMGATAEVADNVRIHTGTVWVTYYHDGLTWKAPGETGSKNDTMIRPDQAVFIVCKGTAPVKVTLTGEVSTVREVTTVPASGEALVGSRHPVEQTLKDLGVHQLSGWRTGDSASVADSVLLWNSTGWDIFYHNGSNWEKAGAFGNADNTPIPATSGLFIKRQAGGAGTPGYLTSALELPPL